MNTRDPESFVVKVTLLLVSTLIVMVTGVVGPALPAIQAHFAGVPHAAVRVRLVLTLPCLFIAVSAPIAGYVVDRVGRKTILAISTIIFGVSGIAGYLAPTLAFLLISRASLGVAVGGLMTSVTTLITDYYAGPARRRFLGVQAAFMGFGGMALMALGGVLADVGWRVPFLAYSCALLIVPLNLLALYEPSLDEHCAEKTHSLSGPGQCIAESICPAPKSNPKGSVVAVMPIRLSVFVYLVMMAVQVAFFLIFVQLPFYLEEMMLASAWQSGLALSVMSLCYALASLQYGRLSSRLDHPAVLTGSVALVGIGYLLIWSGGRWAIIVMGLSLAGVGMGLLEPDLTVWLADQSPLAVRGRALGGLTTALFLGRFVSPILGQVMIAAVGLTGLYLSVAILLLVMATLFWVTRNRLGALVGSMSEGDEDVPYRRRARKSGSPDRECVGVG